MADIRPFTIAVPDDVLTDLKVRLDLARFPENVELPVGEEWRYGTPTQRMKELVEYWKANFDWRKVEANINSSFPQFITPVDAGSPHGELDIHFVHKRSTNQRALPLLFVHGWPGNFLEVSKILEPLTNPSDPKEPAFHVVAPSLPGYVFSEASKHPGIGLKATAMIFDKLMKKLGYKYYVAQGGDWGAMVVKALAVGHDESCRATHTNMLLVRPTFFKNPIRVVRTFLGFVGLPGGYPAHEMQELRDMQIIDTEEMGYFKLQGTKPHSLAYGLTDSPIGLLAWVYEKLHTWSEDYPWNPEEVITWIMLYWVSTAGPVGSVRYYKENGAGNPTGEIYQVCSARSKIPLGVSVFKKELFKFPSDWAGIAQPVKYYKRHEVGGHFAAYEKPELLVDDIRRFMEIVVKEDTQLLNIS